MQKTCLKTAQKTVSGVLAGVTPLPLGERKALSVRRVADAVVMDKKSVPQPVKGRERFGYAFCFQIRGAGLTRKKQPLFPPAFFDDGLSTPMTDRSENAVVSPCPAHLELSGHAP